MRKFIQQHLIPYRALLLLVALVLFIAFHQHEWFLAPFMLIAAFVAIGSFFNRIIGETTVRKLSAYIPVTPVDLFYLFRWLWRGCPKIDQIRDLEL